ncbi:imelysin family protein [Muriicola jejuensis]|uniref:Peptidase M75 n=1 Tax=Muriicola jejuensis TaxID=504488 RepID=A0A6P0UG23_9FLAO|nr:imelysin family protein [Muriicola jejuensis]NER10728.1 peptidase M75 [Muriicola jejuensis]
MKRILLSFGVLLTLWACSPDSGGGGPEPPNPVSFDRGEMLVNWADNIILPSYANFNARLGTMNSAYTTFKSDPSEVNLQTLRDAWFDAYLGWQSVAMFEIGPAETAGYRLEMNTYPTDVITLEQYLSSGSYDLSLPANRDVKGFSALDYLINGLASADAQIVSRYQGTEQQALFDYIDAVIADMQSLTTQVIQGWENGFRDAFVANDGASATASTDRMVNDFIYYFERHLRAGKMGIPLGVFTGTKAPQTLEAYYRTSAGKELFLAAMGAFRDFFNGKHFGSSATGKSLASYLRDLNTLKNGAALDVIINDQITLATQQVSALDDFRTEIENNDPPTTMLLAYDEVQRIVPLLKVDMVSAMSISIDYVDADGD